MYEGGIEQQWARLWGPHRLTCLALEISKEGGLADLPQTVMEAVHLRDCHTLPAAGVSHTTLKKDTHKWAVGETAGEEGGAGGRKKTGGDLRKEGWKVAWQEVGPARVKWGGMKRTKEKMGKEGRVMSREVQ